MNIAYIQHGTWGGPYQTVMADGLQTDSECLPNPYVMGYGDKIPTQYKVLYQGAWRRVYSACYGNSGHLYVKIRGEDVIVDIHLAET